uniref:Nucleolar protein 6 n=1 Tax=Heterorhabditis bacteriophora TaxID=37862 RepID=A0A1I7XDB2_HETBA
MNVRQRKMDEMRKTEKTTMLPVVDFDPIDDLIYNLNSHFHSVALFFYNKYGGDKIGIKWKPQELDVPAKISRCCLHQISECSRLSLNKAEVLEGIRLIGRGIVKNIIH